MEKTVNVYIRRRTTYFYLALAIILIPWIFNLAQTLPSRHLTKHWDALWVGFDILLLVAILLTVYMMLKKTVWLVVSASGLATLFIVDVWFDVVTARPGKEQKEAYFFGVIEIALALLTYRMVYHVLHHSAPEKNLKLITTKK
jgi:hypothetical protein